MPSKDITEDHAESTRALERTRKRIKYALSLADSGLVDFETMDEMCRSLALALRDLDDVVLADVSKRRAA